MNRNAPTGALTGAPTGALTGAPTGALTGAPTEAPTEAQADDVTATLRSQKPRARARCEEEGVDAYGSFKKKKRCCLVRTDAGASSPQLVDRERAYTDAETSDAEQVERLKRAVDAIVRQNGIHCEWAKVDDNTQWKRSLARHLPPRVNHRINRRNFDTNLNRWLRCIVASAMRRSDCSRTIRNHLQRLTDFMTAKGVSEQAPDRWWPGPNTNRHVLREDYARVVESIRDLRLLSSPSRGGAQRGRAVVGEVEEVAEGC